MRATLAIVRDLVLSVGLIVAARFSKSLAQRLEESDKEYAEGIG